ncbi:MAG: hypothetical protein DRO88_05925 [Promethearchaeia archaeon]|nr:MAG: hypothetical protein DRO88_05925 [Candidatus Lokiarchaeia archaeon]
MFNVGSGGIVEPIEFNKANLTPERSIIIMDEEAQTVWLWHGKLRGLVARRTALRQAESLKGHGYQAGNAIIGRDLNKIIEIDARKVGLEPVTTELYQKFEPVLEASYEPIGNLVYIKSDSGSVKTPAVKTPSEKESSPKPSDESSTSVPPKEIKSSQPSHSAKLVEERPVLKHVEKESVPAIPKGLSDVLIQGAVIMAVSTQYKDLWISVKPDGALALEHMDGKICTFKVNGGEISFLKDSFAEVSDDKKAAIDQKIEEYLK